MNAVGHRLLRRGGVKGSGLAARADDDHTHMNRRNLSILRVAEDEQSYGLYGLTHGCNAEGAGTRRLVHPVFIHSVERRREAERPRVHRTAAQLLTALIKPKPRVERDAEVDSNSRLDSEVLVHPRHEPRRYIKKLGDMAISDDGRVTQVSMMTHLYLIHFESHTTETVPPQLRAAFQKKLTGIFNARLIKGARRGSLPDDGASAGGGEGSASGDERSSSATGSPHVKTPRDQKEGWHGFRRVLMLSPDSRKKRRSIVPTATEKLADHEFWLHYVARVMQRAWRRQTLLKKAIRAYREQQAEAERQRCGGYHGDGVARLLDTTSESSMYTTDESGAGPRRDPLGDSPDSIDLLLFGGGADRKRRRRRRSGKGKGGRGRSNSDDDPSIPPRSQKYFTDADLDDLLRPMEPADRLYNPLKYDRSPAQQKALHTVQRERMNHQLRRTQPQTAFGGHSPVGSVAPTPAHGLKRRASGMDQPPALQERDGGAGGGGAAVAVGPIGEPAAAADTPGALDDDIALGADFANPLGVENAEDRYARTAELTTHFYCPPPPMGYSFAARGDDDQGAGEAGSSWGGSGSPQPVLFASSFAALQGLRRPGGGGVGGVSGARSGYSASRVGSATTSVLIPSYGARSATRFPPLKQQAKPHAPPRAAAPRRGSAIDASRTTGSWTGFEGTGLDVSLLTTGSLSEPPTPRGPGGERGGGASSCDPTSLT